MNEVRKKINARMNALEAALKANNHLDGIDSLNEITEMIENVTKYWRIFDNEERDFIHAARYAVNEKVVWR